MREWSKALFMALFTLMLYTQRPLNNVEPHCYNLREGRASYLCNCQHNLVMQKSWLPFDEELLTQVVVSTKAFNAPISAMHGQNEVMWFKGTAGAAHNYPSKDTDPTTIPHWNAREWGGDNLAQQRVLVLRVGKQPGTSLRRLNLPQLFMLVLASPWSRRWRGHHCLIRGAWDRWGSNLPGTGNTICGFWQLQRQS